MNVFGGLISCVRTFGNQSIEGVKTFNSFIRRLTDSSFNSTLLDQCVDENGNIYKQKTVFNNNGGRALVEEVRQTTSKHADFSFRCNNSGGYMSFNVVGTNNASNVALSENINDVNISVNGGIVQTLKATTILYPDYANAVDLSIGSGTIAGNGWLYATNTMNYHGSLDINGMAFPVSGYGDQGVVYVPVKAGDTYNATGSIAAFKFIPSRW